MRKKTLKTIAICIAIGEIIGSVIVILIIKLCIFIYGTVLLYEQNPIILLIEIRLSIFALIFSIYFALIVLKHNIGENP